MLLFNSRLAQCGKVNIKPITRINAIPLITKIPLVGLRGFHQTKSILSLNQNKNLFSIFKQSNRLLSSSVSKLANWQDDMTDRYIRLNRFQQYQKNDYDRGQSNRQTNSLGKLTVFGVASMAGIFLTSHILFEYIPPFTYFKHRPREFIYALLGINVGVFVLWHMPKFWPVLQKHMLLQKGQVLSKWSIIGSAFSHLEFWHLGMNMLALWSFGISLAPMLGTANFFSLYMNSAIAGSLFSLWYPVLARLVTTTASVGASSALFGVVGCFAYLIPNAQILLFVFPIPGGAWVAFLGSIVWNAAGCALKWGTFDYAAHLGGSVVGVLYGWMIHKKVKERRKRVNRRISDSSSRWF